MQNASVDSTGKIVKLPKAEAVEKVAKHLAALRIQLEASKVQLKAAVSPEKYALNFQVNDLKKQINTGKATISRFKKAPGTEVIWSDSFSA